MPVAGAPAPTSTSRRVGAFVVALATVAGLLVVPALRAAAATGRISTVAGSLGEGPATQVAQQPSGVAQRGDSLYVADTRNNVIRVVDLATGRARVIAGIGVRGSRGDGGPATKALLNAPEGIALDAAGNLYVADSHSSRIRRIDTSGQITTVAGSGDRAVLGDGGPAIGANLDYPTDVAVDRSGNLYIADYFNYRVRKVDTAGIITTVAGTGTAGFGGDGGPATRAMLDRPEGVALDSAGNLYIADLDNHRVRRVDAAGVITTVAGSGETGYPHDGGHATETAVEAPQRVQVDADGNLLIAQRSAVRRVDRSGTITTVVRGGNGVDGLGYPLGMVFDADGNLYVAGVWYSDYRVHKVTPAGVVTTVAGNGHPTFSGDGGPAVDAQLGEQPRVAVGPGGELFVADLENDRIRRIDASGTIATIADVDFNIAGDLTFDRAGNLFVAEPTRVRRRDPSGQWAVVAGTGVTGFSGDGGPATSARISYPSGVAVDAAGNLYIADSHNDRVRRVDAAGTITTVAGGGTGGLGDGGPATSATLDLFYDSDVAVDSKGNLYIADAYHDRVRRVDPAGTITTVAGTGEYFGPLGDGGPATKAAIASPGGLTVDGADNLFVVGGATSRVRRIDADGLISTVAGNGTMGYAGDGGPATDAELDLSGLNGNDASLAVDAAGDLLLGESRHIRRVQGVAVPVPHPVPTTTSTIPSTTFSTSTTSTSTTAPTTTTPTAPTTTAPPAPPARARGWGLNHVGELGNGTTAPAYGPLQGGSGLLPGTTEVAAGYYHSAARRDDGTVWAWGWNGYGQVGDGTTSDRLAPVQVPGLTGVRSVAAGAAHTVAVRDDGTVWTWGWNGVGQLGTGTSADRHTPARVPGLTGVVAVSAGAYHNVAVRADGSVVAWGWNHYGQLGSGTTATAWSPAPVAGLGSVRAVAAGGYHSLALRSDGTVSAWGWNAYGQLGTGSTLSTMRATPVPGMSGATSVAAGLVHSLASRTDGTVRSWGWNGVGQLGDGTTVDRRSPVVAGPLTGVQRVTAGAYHSLALGSAGSVTAWGWNAFGQLGDGTTVDRWRPTARPVAAGATSVVGGAGHTLVAA